MNLYIETESGQVKNHPALEDNLLQVFGSIPSHWVPFERIEKPSIGIYEVYEGVTYEWFGDVIKDVHHVRPMTEEEKIAKQDQAKAAWSEHGFVSWVFDEETCSFNPPIAYPNDDKVYNWDETTTSWVEINNA